MTGNLDKPLNKYEKIILRIISTVLIAALINMYFYTEYMGWSELNMIKFISNESLMLLCGGAFVMFTLIDAVLGRVLGKYIDAWVFTITSVFFGLYMLITEKNIYLTLIVAILVIMAIRYVLLRFPNALKKITISNFQKKTILIFVAASTLIYVGSLVVLRYYLFRTPTFDFGIFSQMYYYMKETGLPYTTCERGYYLSHFAIHFSPVFYLILPIYMIFPSPVTLIVLQLLIVCSGAIPVYLMCRKRNYSNFLTVGLTAVFLLYPTMRSGLFYDFHENKFLPPLLLWLLYFLDDENMSGKKKNIGVAVFTILSLTVKEDAAIYVACIGLFNLAYKKCRPDKIRGAVIFIFSVIYFLIVFTMLSKYGEGNSITSIGRYSNLMLSEKDGLIGILTTIIKNPAYVISQLMTEKKLEFVIWTMLPLVFTPLFVKKASVYILMIPYMVMNLLTNYGYQYDITFQYTYGSCTLLIYMTILWFEGNETIKKKMCIIFMVVASLLCTTNALANRNMYYTNAEESMERNNRIFEMLDSIPKSVSVRADTWFVPALSQRDEVYDMDDDVVTDYVVYDMRTEKARQTNSEKIDEMLKNSYEIFDEVENGITIIRKK